MNLTERKKAKEKIRNRNKSQPRVEAIKVTVERKKKCNDKALQIVTDFSEGTIAEDVLLDNLKFLNQDHYQDIVEERAINKLCGYPLCSKPLKNIPSKQYHISTTLNKVFDITDRKNFCSNLCYKASKFLKDQVLTSPLWLREDDSTTYSLISLESRGGMSGEEVDLGVKSIKLNLDELTIPSTDLNKNSYSEEVDTELDDKESHEHCISENQTSNAEQTLVDENETVCPNPLNSLSLNPIPCKSSNEKYEEQASHELVFTESQELSCEDVICKVSADANILVKPTEQHHCQSNDNTKKEEISVRPTSNPSTTEKESKTLDSSISGCQIQAKCSVKNSHKNSSKRKSSSGKIKSNPVNTNPLQNVILKIEQILREWISVDSLCFIFGEEKIKEILAEKKNQNLPAFTKDIHFYERYLAICKKLNVLELEDTKIDSSYKDEAKKPLPDYEALKEEAKQMEIKVKMFFKGDKVQFEDPEFKRETEPKSEVGDVEPVLPLVDIHAQKALRRRIVIDKLRKVLQDVQKSLGLRGFNLTEDVRTLVSTLTLSAHNITMKPAEWNLVAIAVIKLLSLRDSLLARALTSSTANRHLTLLLMSYSLDAGYLDRLMVWLTDVEAVLQKT